ncbi:MAG: primosomal protein N', partial [Lachnospiraceae bacterium]|nr:primosomal protein N' [Lachnospiraceae bacterium]
MIFADVIVDISVKSLDRPFQYKVPEELREDAVIGAQVMIPFGKGNRQIRGFIIGLSGEPKFDIEKTKSISSVLKQGVVAESHLLSLAWWMKENYGSTMNDCIKTVLPVKREIKEKLLKRICPAKGREELIELREHFEEKHYVAKVRVLDALLEEGHEFEKGVSYTELIKRFGATSAVLKGLSEQGILLVKETRQYRNPISAKQRGEARSSGFPLNDEQQYILSHFQKDYEEGVRKPYLIHGVTGSGKTEVYMRLMETVLRMGKQVIVLIPEIALTFQTVKRFYERFGEEVSVIHSRLSAGERYDQFLRARNGDIKIMVGPRSALFTPFENLGLIIMDEEHEPGYQSDNPPKYHAREVALRRAEMLEASVVFGSATPSVEIYQKCQKGACTLFTMEKRAVASAKLPEVSIVDLREEFAARNYSIFSRLLQEKIEERLEKKEQILLFINRRGYAGFVSCRKCGQVMECENCSVSLKAHEVRGRVALLKCHYCGMERQMPEICPACGSKHIGTFGIGTQQVETMFKKRFPSAVVLRMDADT